MKSLQVLAIGITLGLLALQAAADDKKPDYAKLAVGKWDVASSHEGGPPKGGVIEFTKDGKIKVAGEQDGQKMNFDGTYKITDSKMVLTFKIGENNQDVELKIDKLDGKTFATTSSLGKVELKRKK